MMLLISTSPLYALDPDAAPNQGTFSTQFSTYNNQVGSQLNALTSPGLVISKLLPYILTLGGLILFAMLITGGFEVMTAATNAKKADAGKARITTAVIGFVIIFAAYWIAQILEIMTGVSILK